MFSNYNVGNQIDGHQPRTFIPMVNDSLIREKDISLPPFKCGSMYEVVTAVSIQKPSETADSKAIFTDGGELYVSNDNIYYYETKWNDKGEAEKTVIRRIGYKDGKLTSAVQGSIKAILFLLMNTKGICALWQRSETLILSMCSMKSLKQSALSRSLRRMREFIRQDFLEIQGIL